MAEQIELTDDLYIHTFDKVQLLIIKSVWSKIARIKATEINFPYDNTKFNGSEISWFDIK